MSYGCVLDHSSQQFDPVVKCGRLEDLLTAVRVGNLVMGVGLKKPTGVVERLHEGLARSLVRKGLRGPVLQSFFEALQEELVGIQDRFRFLDLLKRAPEVRRSLGDGEDLGSAPPLYEDHHGAVGALLKNARPSHAYDGAFFFELRNGQKPIVIEAVLGHEQVAGLEDVEGKGGCGKEDHPFEGEKIGFKIVPEVLAHPTVIAYKLGMARFERYSVATLLFVVFVILWGALVRATGSGAGCGQHWPLCNGEILPGLARQKTLIELFHRATSGLSLLMVFGLARMGFKIAPRGHAIRKLSILAVVGILVESGIGAALVLLRLVEHDQSLDRAISIALHLTNTCFLVGVLALLTLTAHRDENRIPWPSPGGNRRLGLGILSGFILLAAAGAWTALGDTLFAVSSFSEGWVRDWARDAHFLERLRIVHPVLAALWVTAAIPWLQRLKSSASKWALGLLVANLAIGGLNVLFAAPLPLQILHLAVANALWIALVVSFAG